MTQEMVDKVVAERQEPETESAKTTLAEEESDPTYGWIQEARFRAPGRLELVIDLGAPQGPQ